MGPWHQRLLAAKKELSLEKELRRLDTFDADILDDIGKVSFDAERSARGGHAVRFWPFALACQQERGAGPSKGVEIGVRVLW